MGHREEEEGGHGEEEAGEKGEESPFKELEDICQQDDNTATRHEMLQG